MKGDKLFPIPETKLIIKLLFHMIFIDTVAKTLFSISTDSLHSASFIEKILLCDYMYERI